MPWSGRRELDRAHVELVRRGTRRHAVDRLRCSLVCNVANRGPSPPVSAVEMVSRSRISPTRIRRGPGAARLERRYERVRVFRRPALLMSDACGHGGIDRVSKVHEARKLAVHDVMSEASVVSTCGSRSGRCDEARALGWQVRQVFTAGGTQKKRSLVRPLIRDRAMTAPTESRCRNTFTGTGPCPANAYDVSSSKIVFELFR